MVNKNLLAEKSACDRSLWKNKRTHSSSPKSDRHWLALCNNNNSIRCMTGSSLCAQGQPRDSPGANTRRFVNENFSFSFSFSPALCGQWTGSTSIRTKASDPEEKISVRVLLFNQSLIAFRISLRIRFWFLEKFKSLKWSRFEIRRTDLKFDGPCFLSSAAGPVTS